MVYSGVNPPNNLIIAGGRPIVQELKVEVAAGCYPGRLVIKGTNDDDVVVADGIRSPIGVLGYEQCNPVFRPDNIDAIYGVNAFVPVIKGPVWINAPSGLAQGGVVSKGDYVLSWSDGLVVPAVEIGGKYGLKIPFSKSTDEVNTGIVLPAGSLVRDVLIEVIDNVASSTISVGTLSTAAGDADGFLAGESCATAGLVLHNLVDGTAANNTLGDLIVESDIKSADASALFYSVPNGYIVPTGGKVISYTTTNHDVSGNIYVFLEGASPVGQVEKSVNASAGAADVLYRLII